MGSRTVQVRPQETAGGTTPVCQEVRKLVVAARGWVSFRRTEGPMVFPEGSGPLAGGLWMLILGQPGGLYQLLGGPVPSWHPLTPRSRS